MIITMKGNQMALQKPRNPNYCASVVRIERLVPLENCANVIHAIIFNAPVIVSKDTQVGQIGLFFPLECQLSEQFLSANNLYKHNEKNADKTKKGYFDDHGRIRCIKFRGHSSNGFYIPLSSLGFAGDLGGLKVGDEFDVFNDVPICCKYVPTRTRSLNPKNAADKKVVKRISRLVPNAFRLYVDTAQLAKNVHRISPNDPIVVSNKLHGTSWVAGNVLTRRKLNWFERLLKKCGVQINEQVYDIIYSSRRVIKNAFIDTKKQHWYGYDLWGEIAEVVKPALMPGISLFGECVGWTKNGGAVQKHYDYGVPQGKFEVYVYHATYTNPAGQILSFSWHQLKELCNRYGLKYVPEFYAGKAKDLYPDLPIDENWHTAFFNRIKNDFNLAGDQMCELNDKKVPAEGFVVKVETLDDCLVFKQKSMKFYEYESIELDRMAKEGELDLETQESEQIETGK